MKRLVRKRVIFITAILLIAGVVVIRKQSYAAGGGLKAGWNIVTWQSEWGSGIKYSALPLGCDQLSVRKNNWFESWVRDYSIEKNFEAGKNYYIRCSVDSTWSF